MGDVDVSDWQGNAIPTHSNPPKEEHNTRLWGIDVFFRGIYTPSFMSRFHLYRYYNKMQPAYFYENRRLLNARLSCYLHLNGRHRLWKLTILYLIYCIGVSRPRGFSDPKLILRFTQLSISYANGMQYLYVSLRRVVCLIVSRLISNLHFAPMESSLRICPFAGSWPSFPISDIVRQIHLTYHEPHLRRWFSLSNCVSE